MITYHNQQDRKTEILFSFSLKSKHKQNSCHKQNRERKKMWHKTIMCCSAFGWVGAKTTQKHQTKIHYLSPVRHQVSSSCYRPSCSLAEYRFPKHLISSCSLFLFLAKMATKTNDGGMKPATYRHTDMELNVWHWAISGTSNTKWHIPSGHFLYIFFFWFLFLFSSFFLYANCCHCHSNAVGWETIGSFSQARVMVDAMWFPGRW